MKNDLSFLLNTRWAMLPSALQNMLTIVQRENVTMHELAEAAKRSQPQAPGRATDPAKKGIAARDAQPLPNARRAEVRDKIAIIPVIGPIFPRANLFTQISGGTAVSTLAKDFTVALEDPNVKAIVFNIDSPGGEITGISELADMIFAARGKGKPTAAYVYGVAASAAYWIAAACDKIFASATAETGSIGVVSVWQDTRERDKKSGVSTIEIVSSFSPNKRPDPQTDAGKAQIQTLVDDLAFQFVSSIAKFRGVSNDTVTAKFGQGDVYISKKALDAGMIDHIGSLEGTITAMQNPNLYKLEFLDQNRDVEHGPIQTMTVERLMTEYPTVYEAIFERGRIEGAKQYGVGFDAGFFAAKSQAPAIAPEKTLFDMIDRSAATINKGR
jgi:signal peptide peptidase SppA